MNLTDKTIADFPLIMLGGKLKTMRTSGMSFAKMGLVFWASLIMTFATGSAFSASAQTQESEQSPEGRHICPVQAIRNGTCDPNPGKDKGKPGATNTSGSSPTDDKPKKQPQYKRIAKQTSTAATCSNRVKEIQKAKSSLACK